MMDAALIRQISLCRAAATGDHDKALRLLDMGADPNRVCGGKLPLVQCTRCPDQDAAIATAQLLIARGAKLDGGAPARERPLHEAVANDRRGLVDLLISCGADPDVRADIPPLFDDAHAPLHRAALQRRTRCARLLLAAGADPNARDRNGRAPLHALLGGTAVPAAEDTAVARLLAKPDVQAIFAALLAAGADPALEDGAGVSPIGLLRGTLSAHAALEYLTLRQAAADRLRARADAEEEEGTEGGA